MSLWDTLGQPVLGPNTIYSGLWEVPLWWDTELDYRPKFVFWLCIWLVAFNLVNGLCVGAPLEHLARLFTTLPNPSFPVWVYRSSNSECLGSSQFCSEHVSCPGHVCGFLNSPVCMTTFKCPNLPKKSLSWLFPPGFRQSLAWLNHQSCMGGYRFFPPYTTFKQCPPLISISSLHRTTQKMAEDCCKDQIWECVSFVNKR